MAYQKKAFHLHLCVKHIKAMDGGKHLVSSSLFQDKGC